MITDERLKDIEEGLSEAPEFFKKLSRIVKNSGDYKELYADLAAAPEFFEEIQDIIKELKSYRMAAMPARFNDYQAELNSIIPDLRTRHWGRRGSL